MRFIIGAAVLAGPATLWLVVSNLEATPGPGESPENLTVRTDALSFGTVWCQRALSWGLPVENRSSDRVRVTGIDTSCGCTATQRSELPLDILPGAMAEIPLLIDLRQPGALMGRPREFSVVVAVRTRDQGEFRWRLSGFVRDAFVLQTPRVLDLRSVANGQTQACLTARIGIAPGITDVQAYCTDPTVSVVVSPALNGSSVDLGLSVPNESRPGQRESLIKLSGKSAAGEVAWLDVPLSVSVLPDMQVVPDTTHLGRVRPGEDVLLDLQLSRRTGRPVADPGFRVSQCRNVSVTTGGDGKQLRLRLIALDEGEFGFRLAVRDGDDPATAVTLGYRGLAVRDRRTPR